MKESLKLGPLQIKHQCVTTFLLYINSHSSQSNFFLFVFNFSSRKTDLTIIRAFNLTMFSFSIFKLIVTLSQARKYIYTNREEKKSYIGLCLSSARIASFNLIPYLFTKIHSHKTLDLIPNISYFFPDSQINHAINLIQHSSSQF